MRDKVNEKMHLRKSNRKRKHKKKVQNNEADRKKKVNEVKMDSDWR